MCVRDTKGNAACSPQRPLKCKKAAIIAANLHAGGVTSERERKNKEGKGSLYNPLGKHMGRIEVQLGSFLTLASDGGGWSTPYPGRFVPGHDPIPMIQEAG
jgi:hypothetical protein